jgi:predicted GIY-YIG superfamily endonuclease
MDGYHAYGLVDPRNNDLKYIGETYDIKRRLSAHLYSKSNKDKVNWIKELKDLGLQPVIIILETYDTEDEALKAEVELIAYYRYIGCDLTNQKKGGYGGGTGSKHSQDAKDKMSATRMGHDVSIETREKLRIASTGRIFPKTARDNMSKAQRLLDDDTVSKVCVEYISGSTMKKLGDKYGCSWGAIRNYLIRNNIEIRKRGSWWKTKDKKDIEYLLEKRRINNEGKVPHWSGRTHTEASKSIMRKKAKRKLSMNDAADIRIIYAKGELSAYQIGDIYGVAHSTILRIVNNKTYKVE